MAQQNFNSGDIGDFSFLERRRILHTGIEHKKTAGNCFQQSGAFGSAGFETWLVGAVDKLRRGGLLLRMHGRTLLASFGAWAEYAADAAVDRAIVRQLLEQLIRRRAAAMYKAWAGAADDLQRRRRIAHQVAVQMRSRKLSAAWNGWAGETEASAAKYKESLSQPTKSPAATSSGAEDPCSTAQVGAAGTAVGSLRAVGSDARSGGAERHGDYCCAEELDHKQRDEEESVELRLRQQKALVEKEMRRHQAELERSVCK
jgi:hypothetical protein